MVEAIGKSESVVPSFFVSYVAARSKPLAGATAYVRSAL